MNDDDEIQAMLNGFPHTVVNDKCHYHDWCSEINRYRDQHRLNSGFPRVMDDLLEHFRTVKRQQQIQRLTPALSFNDILLKKVDVLMDSVKNKDGEIQQLQKENAQLSMQVYSLLAQVDEMKHSTKLYENV